MTLVEHLWELRSRLLKSVLAVAATTTAAWFFYEPAIELLVRPVCGAGNSPGGPGSSCGPLVITDLLGPLSIQLKVSLAMGLVAAAPVWLFQLWAFLAPGLHRQERRWAYAFSAAGFPLFLAGALLSYWIMPKAVEVLLGFTPADVGNLIPLDRYLSFVIRMILVFGIAFELPVLVVLLNIAGAVRARQLLSWSRGIVFGIVVFAAVATPTGDPLTMLALAVPMMVLFGISILICRVIDRRRDRRDSALAGLSDDEASPLDATPSDLDE
jgi:sec-independent protein translocase protein TatC